MACVRAPKHSDLFERPIRLDDQRLADDFDPWIGGLNRHWKVRSIDGGEYPASSYWREWSSWSVSDACERGGEDSECSIAAHNSEWVRRWAVRGG